MLLCIYKGGAHSDTQDRVERDTEISYQSGGEGSYRGGSFQVGAYRLCFYTDDVPVVDGGEEVLEKQEGGLLR